MVGLELLNRKNSGELSCHIALKLAYAVACFVVCFEVFLRHESSMDISVLMVSLKSCIK
ncbi:hypothetical protein CMUST_08745 [Corynebacterium mustelae]|uniref:Uncharacterized protein n=1 Tax=Corynebacterium mustelae TaxID=571915 RepID=A0A0G3H2K8_9CORY|nr:hypothetical protein CMUST_08745 [Corynebacterium mustelae]